MGIFYWKNIALYIFGFRTPKVESKESILKYSNEKENVDYVAIASSIEDFNFLHNDFQVPGVIIFNKDMLPIKSSVGTQCPDIARDFIKGLRSDSNYKSDRTNLSLQTFPELISKLSFIKGDSSYLMQQVYNKKINFIIVYSWAKHLPRQSQKMMDVIRKYELAKNGMAVLSINLDFNDRWISKDSLDDMKIEIK
jgi:hypothetical protein